MSLQNLFALLRVPDTLTATILGILDNNDVNDINTLRLVDKNHLHLYFRSPLHIDVTSRAIGMIDEFLAQPMINERNDLQFAVDRELLGHEYFSDLRDGLRKQNVFGAYKELIHYCSHLMLRDNPNRRFTSADQRQVCIV